MEVVYAGQPLPNQVTSSIFLAGPTPRSSQTPSWRPEALQILQDLGYKGHVLVPEAANGERYPEYDSQIDWETAALNLADKIVFWVPRDLETMPAFTTNCEFGEWFQSGKIVFGAPFDAPKNKYLIYKAVGENVPISKSLKVTLLNALDEIGIEGSKREGGECQVPLYIWRTQSFQSWYSNVKLAGNRLDGAKVVWVCRVGPEKKFIFFWALHVDVYITDEDRHKTNEVVIARPDISTVVMYRRDKSDVLNSEIVLIREFRSPVSNKSGYVWEVPGGSSFKPTNDPQVLAAEEVHEETGLELEPRRIVAHGARQLVATMSAHKAHMFSVEITAEELRWLRSREGIANGVEEDTERTYVEIMTLRRILQTRLLDWSMIGMIMAALA